MQPAMVAIRTAKPDKATIVTFKQALDFIRYYGVVLEAAKGQEPSLAERVAGERIAGSWWGHPKGHEIFELTRKVHDSRAVLICTLAKGRITYIHRRLWPYFICLASRFPTHSLDRVREVHLPTGRHKREDILFPEWVPTEVMQMAKILSVKEAEDQISLWLRRYGVA